MRVKMQQSEKIDDLATTYHAGEIYEVPAEIGHRLRDEGKAVELGADNKPLPDKSTATAGGAITGVAGTVKPK